VYHDAEKGERVMEIPATDSGQRKESEEERHEQARLTYVAFTRAKAECHVFRKTARNSKETVGGVEDCGVILPNPADIAESNRLFGRETVPDNLVRRWNAPEPVAPNTRALRTFRTVIPNDFGIRSFSALAAGSDEHGAVLRTIPTEDEPLEGMAAFPRGPHAGTALHSLLETVDFANPASFQTEIESVFVRHALPMRHSGAVQDLLMHLGAWEPEPGVPLNTIPRKQIRTECRFTLRLTHPDRTRFQELQIDETRYDIETGFLVGSIDVLIAYKGRYHIIDWKSNWLGPTPDAYTEEAIAAEMLYHNYHLQYKIYAVALRKYLLSRGLKVNDCKEIRIHYLFLRAARRGRFPLFSATATKEALDIWELALIGRG
jgi:exodeoxyribonuclease V beta subunit